MLGLSRVQEFLPIRSALQFIKVLLPLQPFFVHFCLCANKKCTKGPPCPSIFSFVRFSACSFSSTTESLQLPNLFGRFTSLNLFSYFVRWAPAASRLFLKCLQWELHHLQSANTVQVNTDSTFPFQFVETSSRGSLGDQGSPCLILFSAGTRNG